MPLMDSIQLRYSVEVALVGLIESVRDRAREMERGERHCHPTGWDTPTRRQDVEFARDSLLATLDALTAAAKREWVREAVERLTLRDYGALVDALERELALDRTKNGHTVVLRNILVDALGRGIGA